MGDDPLPARPFWDLYDPELSLRNGDGVRETDDHG
jgi:hypothetical protein